jgi:transketolase C-terminal domain/subunit
MRTAFFQNLLGCSTVDSRIVLPTGDLRLGGEARYVEQPAKQFVNMAVAGQNMTGLAWRG